MNYLNSFESFLGEWSNIISFFGIVSNVLVAVAVFCMSRQILEKNYRNCFESIIEEMCEQFGFMCKLCDYLCNHKQDMDKIIEEEKEGSFLALLWKFRHEVNTVWVTLPLHKFEQHCHLFDNYSENAKMKVYGQKIHISDLNGEMIRIINYLEKAVDTQERMKIYFSKMEKLLIINNQSKKETRKIIEKIDNTQLYTDFITYLNDNRIDWCIDWECSRQLWLEFVEVIDLYSNNRDQAVTFIKQSETLSNYAKEVQ